MIFRIFLLIGVLFFSSVRAAEGYLPVSERHEIYYATYGNPEGIPVVVLHGGPGAGCSKSLLSLFDLDRYYVVLFDQRGAMRSRPFASMEENTTPHLIADIEQLRHHLGIDRWAVFGGSWGSLLALVYGQAHPEACLGFVLRGIFLGESEEGLKNFLFSEEKQEYSSYRELIAEIAEEERSDLLAAIYQKLLDPDPGVHLRMARSLMRHYLTVTSPTLNLKIVENDRFALSLMRAASHYARNNFFLEPGQPLAQMEKIAHLPAILIHGTKDLICPPAQAQLLHKNWPRSELRLVEGGGHEADDPAIAAALAKALREITLPFESG